jgi:hypothetical protein
MGFGLVRQGKIHIRDIVAALTSLNYSLRCNEVEFGISRSLRSPRCPAAKLLTYFSWIALPVQAVTQAGKAPLLKRPMHILHFSSKEMGLYQIRAFG